MRFPPYFLLPFTANSSKELNMLIASISFLLSLLETQSNQVTVPISRQGHQYHYTASQWSALSSPLP